MNTHLFGIIAAIISNILFSLLFFYGTWLSPLSGVDIFAWRLLATFPTLCLFISLSKRWQTIQQFAAHIGRDWQKWGLIILPIPIMAGQLCLFMWAPLHGKGVDVAIGYFIFPLAMALGGVLVFRERLNRMQKWAIALAAIGVLLAISSNGRFSWVSVVIFTTYPIYYLLRRYLGVPALIGLFIDMLLVFPFVAAYLFFFSPSVSIVAMQPSLIIGIVILGVHSSAAMLLNLSANQHLPVVLFGMLSYLEPALLFIISVLFLNEVLTLSSVISYAFIWLGIILVMQADFRKWRRSRRASVL